MKKRSISEVVYLFLSLALMALSVLIYLVYSQREQEVVKKVQEHKAVAVPKTDPALDNWTKRLEALEKAPKADLLLQLKADFEQLKDSDKKEALAARLTDLETEMERITTAEEAVVLAETYGYQSYITEAQALVNTIKTPASKEALQARLDLLFVPAQPAATITPEQPATNYSTTNSSASNDTAE